CNPGFAARNDRPQVVRFPLYPQFAVANVAFADAHRQPRVVDKANIAVPLPPPRLELVHGVDFWRGGTRPATRRSGRSNGRNVALGQLPEPALVHITVR